MANRLFNLQGAISILASGAQGTLNSVQSLANKTSHSILGLERSTEGLNKSFNRVQGPTLKWALQLTGIRTALQAVQQIASGAVTSTLDYEAGVRNLNTILKLGEDGLAVYSEKLRTLGKDLKLNVSATESVGAAYDVAQAGFEDAADNMNVMTAALKASAASGTPATKTANLLASTLKAYNLRASEAGRVSDIYFKVVENGIITFDQLATSIGAVNPIAAQAGIELEEIGAIMATVTNRGVRAHVAVAGLRQILNHLIATKGPGRKELEKYGIAIDEHTLKQKGLINTLLEIREATGGNAAALVRILGDVNAFNVALAATSQNGKNVKKDLDDMNTSLGSTQAAIEEQSKSTQFALGQLRAGFEAFGINVLQGLSKPFGNVIRWLTDVIDRADDFATRMSRLGKGNFFAGLFESLAQSLPATHSMLTQIWKTVQELGKQWLSALMYFQGDQADTATTWLDFVAASLLKIVDAILNVIGHFGTFVGYVVTGLELMSTTLGALWDSMGPAASKAFEGLKELVGIYVEVFIDQFQAFVDYLETSFNRLPAVVKKALGVSDEEVKNSFAGMREGAEALRPETKGSLKNVAKTLDQAGGIVKDALTAAYDDYGKRRSAREARSAQKLQQLNGKGPEKAKSPVKPDEPLPSREGGSTVDTPGRKDPSIPDKLKAIEQEIELEKISKAEGIQKYQALLKLAITAKLRAEDLFDIEKKLLALRKEVTRELEKQQDARNKLHIQWLKNTKGETAADLAQLQIDKTEKLKEGVPQQEVDRWAESEKARIAKEDEERLKKAADKEHEAYQNKLKLDQQILESTNKVLDAKLKALDIEKDKLIQNNNDLIKTEQWYQAERLRIIRTANAERVKNENATKQLILQNEADAETNPMKKAALERKATNIGKLQAIRDNIARMREESATDIQIAKYVASEKKKILAQSKRDREEAETDTGSSSGPMTMEEAFSGGFTLKTSSLNSSSKRRASRAERAADRELANAVGNLMNENMTAQGVTSSTVPQETLDKLGKKKATTTSIGITPLNTSAIDSESAGPTAISVTKDASGQTVISNRRKQGTNSIIKGAQITTSALGIGYGPDGQVTSSDPTAAKAAADLTTAQKGVDAVGGSKDAVTAIESILTIRFQDDSGNIVRTESVKGSGEKKTESQLAYDYKPGRYT